MAAKGAAFASDLLKLIFQNMPLPLIGDVAGLQPSELAGSLYLSLHTADLGADGNQETNEAAYPGYVRMAVERSEAGWTVVGNAVSPTSIVTFPEGGAGEAGLCPFAAIGTEQTGPGKVLYRGALNPKIQTGEGIAPQIKPTSMITEL